MARTTISTKLIPWKEGHQKQFLKVFLIQFYFTFIEAIPILALIGLLSGVAFAFQTQLGLSILGGKENLGKFLVYIMFRELVPFLTSMLIITRSVTAVASELATMKAQKEIKSLTSMGINIFEYLIAPRLIAGSVAFFAMSISLLLFSILGSWIGSNWSGYYPFSILLNSIANTLTPIDFLFFLLKTLPTGAIVFFVGAREGLSLKKASFEVPIVTHKAVVEALLTAILFQLTLSLVFYAFTGFKL